MTKPGRPVGVLALTLVVSLAAAARAATDPACATFTWEMSQELALFGTDPAPIVAGRNAEQAPRIDAGRLYLIELAPRGEVRFPVPASRPAISAGAHAGMLRFEVGANGRYRISGGGEYRIDVVVDGQLAEATGFQASPACRLVHKSVEFQLPGGRELVLLLSNASAAPTRLAITPAPSSRRRRRDHRREAPSAKARSRLKMREAWALPCATGLGQCIRPGRTRAHPYARLLATGQRVP